MPPPIASYRRVGGPVKWGRASDSSSRPSDRRKRSWPDTEISAVSSPLVIRASSPEICTSAPDEGWPSSAPGSSSRMACHTVPRTRRLCSPQGSIRTVS